ncbi:MAG: hypothetical protein WDZ76_01510 [Pseudohongiellaceae bacterium]
MNAEALHNSFRELREGLSENQSIRLHRAISWLRCAEGYGLNGNNGKSDDDIAFIALWIAFNACYAIDDESDPGTDSRTNFDRFTRKLCELDQEHRIHNLLWMKYSQFVRLIIDNKYVFAPFWTSARAGNSDWESSFAQSKKLALHALANNDTPLLLSIILDRLYVLRNQLVHGGATYKSQVNRSQVRDGKNLLFELIPVCIELMLTEEDWGEIYYPVVD